LLRNTKQLFSGVSLADKLHVTRSYLMPVRSSNRSSYTSAGLQDWSRRADFSSINPYATGQCKRQNPLHQFPRSI